MDLLLLSMKKVVISIFCLFASTLLFAQTDSLNPKWEKGQFWKITSHTVAPVRESIDPKKELEYYTTISEFLWEVLDITDSNVVLSILPISMHIESDNEATIASSQLTVDGFNFIKAKNTPLIYRADKNGALFPSDTTETDPKFFLNDSLLQSIITQEYLNIEGGEEYLHDNGGTPSEYVAVTAFFYQLMKNIHLPFGQDYILNQTKDIATSKSNEKWMQYSQEFKEMIPFMAIDGFENFRIANDHLLYNFDVNMNLGSALKNIYLLAIQEAKNKKEKKEMMENYKKIEKLKLNISINGNYEYEQIEKTPKKYVTVVKFDGNGEGESIKFTSSNTLIFE